MNTFYDDTIVALATPPGVGAISVIRISGKKSIESIDKIFSGKKRITESPTHTIHYGKIIGESETIDDVLVSVFIGPNSYTGEDSVEISTHGSPLIAQKIIETLIKQDVRIAEPGEFTKRAFLNGRIDLAQAEAVVDVIHSRTEASLRGARNQLDGLLSLKINSLREKLVNTSSLMELELDFAEEDLQFLSSAQIVNNIDSVVDEINLLLSTYSFGRVIRDGVNVAIVGKPNVGKSSLLNYILKESRAIVSETPGTTRDVLREEVSIDGILFRLFDTAGIRTTQDSIEQEGVARSRQSIKDADIVLFINDVLTGFSEELYTELLELTVKEKISIVMNKIDLMKDCLERADIKISALTGEGMDVFLKCLKEKGVGNQSYSERAAIVSNIRHYESLRKAKGSLENAKESIYKKLSAEFISVDLRNAEDALSEIIGKVTSDDILNNIFSKFCIGK
ncbi:MAG: tRNA uridine-5-carboxymethylaminomethyl(34) synthesis GTPase MnmE [bacterium]